MQNTPYKPSFAENVALDKGASILYTFTAKNLDNEDVWCTVAVSKENNAKFIHDTNTVGKDVDVTKYGHIIAHGMGTEPI